tara:strand:- start:8602 stop:9114 length:513 start_codon:yes stop_codon:yes gene_type:complete
MLNNDTSNNTFKKNKDNCQELKNLAYKTMLLNGTNINPIYEDLSNNLKISNFLESESKASKLESWAKLDKTQKIKRLNNYAECLKSKHHLSDGEILNLKNYFIRCLDRKNLIKSKDVIYDKDNNIITNIPNLIFVIENRNFILKKDDKHVSTIKSLPQDKKNNKKTIKIL